MSTSGTLPIQGRLAVSWVIHGLLLHIVPTTVLRAAVGSLDRIESLLAGKAGTLA